MKRESIVKFMDLKLSYLTQISGQGEGAGQLALLRRGLGRVPGEIPELLGVLLVGMPGEFMSQDARPSREEWACYTALTLYAMHQQGSDPQRQNVSTADEVSLGAALAEYVRQSPEDHNARGRMAQKLQMLASAKDMAELSYHLRGVVRLLKTRGVDLNYPRLAGDLYEYQFPQCRPGIFLTWGQDFYRVPQTENEDTKHQGEDS